MTDTTPSVRRDLYEMHRRYVTEYDAYFDALEEGQADEADEPDPQDFVERLEAEGHDMARLGRHLLAEFLNSDMNRFGYVHTAHGTRDY